MRKLYEIEADIENLIELDAERFVNGETGEIVNREVWDSLHMEWSQKVEGVALGYKNAMAMAESIKKEVDELTERMNHYKKMAEGYKSFLQMVLDGKKFETSRCVVRQTKSKSVEWDGCRDGLGEYLTDVEPKFNKAQARKDLLAGKYVPHCKLVENASISIK